MYKKINAKGCKYSVQNSIQQCKKSAIWMYVHREILRQQIIKKQKQNKQKKT